MTRPLLKKICGITNPEDALAAINAGADWLGLIFVPGTPRFVALPVAQQIAAQVCASKRSVELVGVFQNASLADIQTHWETLPLNQIQLHGQESVEFCSTLPTPVIKTFFLYPETDVSALAKTVSSYLNTNTTKTALLDLPKGGALKSILEFKNHPELARFFQDYPCLMAGGLNPENIQQALHHFQPLGVDVASGVEQSTGKKDVQKMQQFCKIVTAFESQTTSGENPSCNL